MKISKLALATLGALMAMGAQASQYVLQAPKWGATQQAAVAKAGGTVKFSHDGAGMAVVQSDNPNFLAAVKAGGAVTSGAADRVVQWTQPLSVIETSVNTSDDTYYNVQWAPQSIHAPEAWAAGYDGSGVRVAVIDGGIYDAHVDLQGAIDVAKSTSFVDGVAFNQDVGTFWHGTHVAGIIAARDNNKGVIGIAPKATIIGVKALHNGSGDFGAVISAIIYAGDRSGAAADIINMSLGAEFDRNEDGAAELRSLMNRAVNYATSQGALVVAAAGNSGIDFDAAKNLTDTPAESGNAIAVSATAPVGWATGLPGTDNFTHPASYSNYGNSMVWVAGPGGDASYPNTTDVCARPAQPSGLVVQRCYVFDFVFSTSRGTTAAGGYSWAAGTSMATPAVAAVAALIKQRFPNATPAQLKTKLAQTADDAGKVGQDNFYGNGYVNAYRAVTQ